MQPSVPIVSLVVLALTLLSIQLSVRLSSTSSDTITDFTTGTDKLNVTLDYSTLASAATVNATIVTEAAGITAVQNSLSAERGQYIYDTTNSKLYVNVNNDNLITSLDYHINSSNKVSGVAFADGDLNFSITGGTASDTITAGAGADTIAGGNGADSIVSGTGDDSITGGAGDDTLTGGGGSDTFVVSSLTSTNGTDTITDFTTGTGGDVLKLGLTLANGGTAPAITMASKTALATEGSSIAVGDGEFYVAVNIDNIASIDTAAEVATALTDTGILDAVDLSVTSAGDTGALVLVADDDTNRVLVWGYTLTEPQPCCLRVCPSC